MTAASPGVVPHFMKDQYYGSEEKYYTPWRTP